MKIDSLETMLADSLRSYVSVSESGTDEDLTKGLRDVCDTAARLLGLLLEADDRWNRFWWIDALLPTPGTAVLSGRQLQLQGLIIWGQKGTSREWVEPCWTSLSDAEALFTYEMRCGDAVRGLGKVAYEQRREVLKLALPEHWQFVFAK